MSTGRIRPRAMMVTRTVRVIRADTQTEEFLGAGTPVTFLGEEQWYTECLARVQDLDGEYLVNPAYLRPHSLAIHEADRLRMLCDYWLGKIREAQQQGDELQERRGWAYLQGMKDALQIAQRFDLVRVWSRCFEEFCREATSDG
ncbi:MAG: hypothetical protein DIU70_006385 [Bacillota bacterium]|nr:MAG: hypothetical protein DIU70_14145 [Bacillota bacterium]